MRGTRRAHSARARTHARTLACRACRPWSLQFVTRSGRHRRQKSRQRSRSARSKTPTGDTSRSRLAADMPGAKNAVNTIERAPRTCRYRHVRRQPREIGRAARLSCRYAAKLCGKNVIIIDRAKHSALRLHAWVIRNGYASPRDRLLRLTENIFGMRQRDKRFPTNRNF